MRDERTPPDAGEPAPQDVLEHAVLHEVLARHPAQLVFHELVLAMGDPLFLVQDAVTQLVADGLLHRNGEFVVPSRPAVRFDELSF
jgi:hypothetical protein